MANLIDMVHTGHERKPNKSMTRTPWWKQIPKRIQLKNFEFWAGQSELIGIFNGSLPLTNASDDNIVFAHFVQLFTANRQGDHSHHSPILDELNDRRNARHQKSQIEQQPASLLDIAGAEFEGREMRAALNVKIANSLSEDPLLKKFLEMLTDDELAELLVLAHFSPIHGPREIKWVTGVALDRR